VLEELAEKAERECPVKLFFKAPMTERREGKRPADFERLAAQPNCVAFSDDGDPVTQPEVLADVCQGAARVGLPLSPHCEDSPRALADYAAGISPGFEPGEPYANESLYIARDLRAAQKAGARVHFSHVSLAESVQLIVAHRGHGEAADAMTFEATPHHLLLCRDEYADGEVPTVNPPLRSAADREALVRALVRGEVDAIASDHAPHTAEDKAKGACGLVGLETTLGLILTHFVHTGKLTPLRAAALLSTRPAHIFGLPAGSAAEGVCADLVLVDPHKRWEVRAEQFASLSRKPKHEAFRRRQRSDRGVSSAPRRAFRFGQAGDHARERCPVAGPVCGALPLRCSVHL